MRILSVLLLLLFGGVKLSPCEASGLPGNHASATVVAVKFQPPSGIFQTMTPKMYRGITGKRMTLKERIALKVLQWKAKWRLREEEPTERQIRQGKLSLIFGAVALVTLFIPYVGVASLPLAIAGLVLGIKSLKGNSNTMAILGVVFSGLVLFIFLLAVVILTALIAGWR